MGDSHLRRALPQLPALTLGSPSPHPELFPRVEGVLETLRAHRTLGANLPRGSYRLPAAGKEDSIRLVGREIGAQGVDMPLGNAPRR